MTAELLIPRLPATLPNGEPSLEPGDKLDQPTFHRRYEAMPPHIKAELIGGVVHMPSPLRYEHGRLHSELIGWLSVYKLKTNGVSVADNATQILGKDSELQPDASLHVIGGTSHITENGYIKGPTEFVAEVALSSVAIDLHRKKADYERYGVQEYLVLIERERRAVWFVSEARKFVEHKPSADGILRSRSLPGLWLDAAALFASNSQRLIDVLEAGLATPEHAAFVEELKSLQPQPPK